MPRPLRVLYLYAEADAPLRRALEEQLAVFRRSGQLAEWGADWLLAGDQVLPELTRQIQEADVLVPIVSAALFSSDRDYQLLLLALRRHDDEGTPLVPIGAVASLALGRAEGPAARSIRSPQSQCRVPP